MGKFLESTEKVDYRFTTENIPLCNYTIIVLKITPLHSVSVIRKFVIPKRDKQTKTKLENNMHHLHEAMQYRQALCVADRFLSLPFSKNRKNFEFLVKISPKGQILLSNFFYRIKGGERVPGPYPHAKFHHCHS